MKEVFNSSEMIMKTCLLFKYPFKYNVQNVAKNILGRIFLRLTITFVFPKTNQHQMLMVTKGSLRVIVKPAL